MTGLGTIRDLWTAVDPSVGFTGEELIFITAAGARMQADESGHEGWEVVKLDEALRRGRAL